MYFKDQVRSESMNYRSPKSEIRVCPKVQNMQLSIRDFALFQGEHVGLKTPKMAPSLVTLISFYIE